MAKLTKDQRMVLFSAVQVFEKNKVNQPVYCDIPERAEIDKFSKSYATYNKQMYKLLDAGILRAHDEVSAYAIVADYDRAREALKNNCF